MKHHPSTSHTYLIFLASISTSQVYAERMRWDKPPKGKCLVYASGAPASLVDEGQQILDMCHSNEKGQYTAWNRERKTYCNLNKYTDIIIRLIHRDMKIS